MRYPASWGKTCLAVALMLAVATPLPRIANASTQQQWRFTVHLDDTPIGHHVFRVEQVEGYEKVTTEARFDVSFLKIPLFRYRHQDVQLWNNQCLKSINSTTDQNGKLFRVDGSTTTNGFQVSANGDDITLPPCISTFAYWDKSFLQHSHLLNSQTGEYLEVDVEDLGEQSIPLSDTSLPAKRYRLTANELDIELWYASDGRWLGLESTTGNGRLLRYVIE